MEVDQIQCKFPKIINGGYASSTIVSHGELLMDDEDDEGDNRRSNPTNGSGAADPGGGVVGLYGWPSSRIVRVSRATGGKDRHSKVLTSRGLRDRRVRLSVNTAIDFYDLQDRLGYDQPSKAVEWLLAAAATSIAELPPMNPPFPLPHKEDNPKLTTLDPTPAAAVKAAKAKSSAGSSNSETSKGSIARSENRFREREKAEKRESDKSSYVASFTELLSSGGISYINSGGDQRPLPISDENSNFFPKFSMDYFSSGISVPPAAAELQQQPFSFSASDHLVSAVSAANSASINRGTLQSNSNSSPPSLHFPTNFFGGGTTAGNYHRFFPGFDARLHLYNGEAEANGGRNSATKRKDKP